MLPDIVIIVVCALFTGSAQVINRGDVGQYGTMFKIVYETTKTYTNQKSCFVINGTSDGTVKAQGIFPDISSYIVSFVFPQVLKLFVFHIPVAPWKYDLPGCWHFCVGIGK